MLVRDVMSTDVVAVSRTATVKAALVLLARHHITSMPVLDRDGRVCGVVSEADLVRDLVPLDPRAHELPPDEEWRDRPHTVGEVMTAHVLSVHRDADVAAVVELITGTAVKSVPVVDGENRVVGILSRSDLVRVLARADADLERDVDTLLTSVGLADWMAEVSEGVVELSGPAGSGQKGLAHLVASTVPGVVEVRVD
jgi:CBS-domain-containing membrane protein